MALPDYIHLVLALSIYSSAVYILLDAAHLIVLITESIRYRHLLATDIIFSLIGGALIASIFIIVSLVQAL